MNSEISTFMFILSVALLGLTIFEIYKSLRILFFDKKEQLLAFQLATFLINIIPFNIENRRNRFEDVYYQRRKLYAVFTLLGGLYFVILFLQTIILFLE